MLVLRRKIGQSITVGDPHSGQPPAEVTVIAIRGEIVEFAVEAAPGSRYPKPRVHIVRTPRRFARLPTLPPENLP